MSYYVTGNAAVSGLGQADTRTQRRGTVYKAAKGAKGATIYKGAKAATIYKGAHQHVHPRTTTVSRWQAAPGSLVARHGVHGLGLFDEDPYLALLRRGGGGGLSGLMGAFGAADPGAVCSDWMAGGDPSNPDAGAGGRAASAIQQALNDAGYGPIAVDGVFGNNSIAAWDKFADANPGTAHGWPDCAGITKLMSGGAARGTGGPSKAGVAFGILAAGLVALGALALLSKRKKHGHHAGHGETITIREGRS